MKFDNSEQLKKTILDLLAEIAPEIEPEQIKSDENLREQIDIDSIDFLSLMTRIHEKLGVNIPESDYAQLDTLDHIVAYLEERLAGPISSS